MDLSAQVVTTVELRLPPYYSVLFQKLFEVTIAMLDM
jgi:hypothetical protein